MPAQTLFTISGQLCHLVGGSGQGDVLVAGGYGGSFNAGGAGEFGYGRGAGEFGYGRGAGDFGHGSGPLGAGGNNDWIDSGAYGGYGGEFNVRDRR